MSEVRRWYTFSIRELFFLTTIAALVICWSLDNLKKQETIEGLATEYATKEMQLTLDNNLLKGEFAPQCKLQLSN